MVREGLVTIEIDNGAICGIELRPQTIMELEWAREMISGAMGEKVAIILDGNG